MADEEQEYYGYYYGDDEDRGLLDPAWEKQQKKVCFSLMTLLMVLWNDIYILYSVNSLRLMLTKYFY